MCIITVDSNKEINSSSMTSMVKFNRFNNVVYNYILMGILIMASES